MNAPSSGSSRQAPPAHDAGSLVRDLETVQRIVLHALEGRNVKVFLLGSTARGTAGLSSDIDVGVLPLEPLPAGLLAAIRDALEESRAVRPVDLVDLSHTTPEFRSKALKEGLPWTA